MGMKYLKNTDDATIICKIPSDKNKTFVFRNKQVDKRNNIVISSGYSEVSDEDLALLREESHAFKYYEEKGKIVLVDSLPQEAMSPEQLIMVLRTENEELKAKLQANDLQQKLDEATARIAELESSIKDCDCQQKLDEATAKIAEQDKIIEALDVQLVEMASEIAEVEKAKTQEKE